MKLILYFLTNPISLFWYLSLNGVYRYALKTLLRFDVKNAASIAKKIAQQKDSEISFSYKNRQIFMRNEIGVIYYMTEGIRKLEKMVNNVKLPPNATVIDAGGNVGLFSLLLKERFPDAKIMVIEPSETLLPILRKNLKPWNTDITFCEKALTEKVGTIKFFVNRDAEQTNSIDKDAIRPFVENDDNIDEILVPTIDLKSLIEQSGLSQVDLLKLDIQGAELEVLKSSINEFHRIKELLVEISFVAEQSIQLCGFITNHYPKTRIVGEVKMGADIVFSK